MNYRNHHVTELYQYIMHFVSLNAFQDKLNKFTIKCFARSCYKIRFSEPVNLMPPQKSREARNTSHS